MKKGKNEYGAHFSIKLQIAFSLLSVVIMIITVCIIMNTFFLDDFYVKNKQEVLKSAYSMLNDTFIEGDYDSDEMSTEIRRVCETYNISMIVLDEKTDTVMSSVSDTRILTERLFDNIFGNSILNKNNDAKGEVKKTIIEKFDNCTLQIEEDTKTGDQYIELWGLFENGNMFLMSSAINGIEDSITITNRFLIYTGIIVAVLSIVTAIILSGMISTPIMELSKISERMKNLDFEAKYNGRSDNEIGILGKNINELSETLETTISELKTANIELERDLDNRVKMDEIRTEFLSNVSHELKTPLALILGYAEGLKDCVNDDPESRDFYCDVIIDETTKMNNMVKQVLSLNQIEFGNEVDTLERFDIVALIKNYLQSVEILAKQNDVNVYFGDYEPIYVWGDQFKVEEVFSNYFSNALNHIGGERKIDITIHSVLSNSVRISVFNSGDPIPEESVDKIWDKFYKVDKARTREYGGSGIGLSIVKAIQESMNQGYGVINYNDGVEFYFELDTSGRR